MKKEILVKIKLALQNPAKGVGMMGIGDRFYNAYYLVGSCFTEEELNEMNEMELALLLKLADFAVETFY